jgi:hypothetical protein
MGMQLLLSSPFFYASLLSAKFFDFISMNKILHALILHGKKYPYALQPNRGEKTTRVVCADARLDQIFLNEDIPALLKDLPNLISSEKRYGEQSADTIRFRVTSREKRTIAERAHRAGLGTISSFLRNLALK